MSGPPPYDGRSPPRQHRYPYSPSGRELPSYNDSYQHPPHTPPGFPPPSSLARSPQYGRPNSPPMNTLPPLNGSAVNSDVSPSFHGPDGARGPSYTLPRPFNNSMMPPAGSPQPLFSPHTHPSAAHDGLSRSPRRESDTSFDARGRLAPMLQDRPPSPQERVSKHIHLHHQSLHSNNGSVTEACSDRPHVVCQYPLWSS